MTARPFRSINNVPALFQSVGGRHFSANMFSCSQRSEHLRNVPFPRCRNVYEVEIVTSDPGNRRVAQLHGLDALGHPPRRGIRRVITTWKTAHTSVTESADAPMPDNFVVPDVVEPYDAWLEVNAWNGRRESLLRRKRVCSGRCARRRA